MCDPPATTTSTVVVCEASTGSLSTCANSVTTTSKTDAVSSSAAPASSYVLGRAADGIPIVHTSRPTMESILQQQQQQNKINSSNNKVNQDNNNDKAQPPPLPLLVVGVGGNWYDVTHYIPYHPGGDILMEFLGRDATAQFMAYHSPRVLRTRKPVGTYDFDAIQPGGQVMEGDWMALSDKYERLGYYHTPLWFVASRLGILAAFLCTTLTCVYVYTKNSQDMLLVGGEWTSRLILLVGSIALAGFWQQSGFLLHDAMHNLCFHNRRYDQPLGWFFGNVFLGISSKWWRDEHNEHHLFTNTAVDGVGISDPQMVEDAWIQDVMLDQFFHPVNELPPLLRDFLVKYQFLLFVPLCMVAGPYTIKVLSWMYAKRPMEYVGIALHFVWVSSLLSCFSTWLERLVFYATANFFIGILSIQLLVSHYSKPWVEKETVKVSGSWAKRQVESVVDIDCPPWLDWFHGGLHLHSPHHLFPRLPRCYYRQVHEEVKELCKKNGVELTVMPFFEAVASTLQHLKQVGDHLTTKND